MPMAKRTTLQRITCLADGPTHVREASFAPGAAATSATMPARVSASACCSVR